MIKSSYKAIKSQPIYDVFDSSLIDKVNTTMLELQNTQLLGHRGARHERFENSLQGFQHAYHLQAHGLAGVEFDVQLTADGHLVVFHDDTLQRLCGLQSRIDQLSLVEIQRHLQSGHQIITLDKLASKLTWAVSSSPKFSTIEINHPLIRFSHIELEIKTHSRTSYPQLIRALCHYLLDSPLATLPIVLTCFDLELLAQLQRHKRLSAIARGLLVQETRFLRSAPNTALQLGCRQLGIHYPLLNQQVIKYCHRYGLPVSAWTVNDVELIKQLVHWQVDVIITDIPTQLLTYPL